MPASARPPLALLTLLIAAGLLVVVQAVPPSDAPDIQLQLGHLLTAEGRYSEAAAAFRHALASAEARIRVPARKGLVLAALKTGDFGTARTEGAVLADERREDPEALAIFGDAMWASGLFDEAAEGYHAALALQPDLPRGHSGISRVLLATGHADEALDHALTAVRFMPREPDFHHTVGSIYERMGRYEQAAQSIASFINLLPKGFSDTRAIWSIAELRFLNSFGRRKPYEIAGTPGEVYKLPFRIENEKIVIEGRLNGSRPLDFVVDTGSELTTVSRGTSERQDVVPVTYTISAGVGEVGLRGLQLGRVDRLEFGHLKIRNVPCIIKSPALRDLPTAEGESFSPLALGLSMSIDYVHHMLTLARRLPDEGPADQTMGLWMHRLATVRGMVGGHPRSFVVDTGGQVISISTDTAEFLPRPPATSRRIALKVYGASGWDRDAYLLPGVNLAFQDIRFDKMSVVVLNLRAPSVLLGYELGGIVGHQFLSRYTVSIDLERAELRLKKS